MFKKQNRLVLLLVSLVFNLQAQDHPIRRALEDYYFILLMPAHQEQNYLCAVFALADLKVCRFPGGPVWSNSLAANDLFVVSPQVSSDIQKSAHKLAILCLDYANFKMQCQNDCKQNICGFALPWDLGMAYVFDDLQTVDQVCGVIMEKKQLAKFKLPNCLKKSESIKDDLLVIDLEQIDREVAASQAEPDDIDLLLAGGQDIPDQLEFKPMSYPVQKLVNFFGKIAISCLMGYHDIRQKIVKIVRKIYARSEA